MQRKRHRVIPFVTNEFSIPRYVHYANFCLYFCPFADFYYRDNKLYESANVQTFKYSRNFGGDSQKLKYLMFVAGNNENALRRSY